VVKRRKFTPEFKAKVVLEVLSGTKSAAAICREYGLKPDLLSRWKTTFVERAPLIFHGEERISQEQVRVAELERLVGQQALELGILKRGSSILASLPSRNGR
jgi:transposase